MTQSDPYFAIAFSVLFLVVFGSLELVKRKFKLSAEITRRFAHILAGLLVLLDFAYLSTPVFAVLIVSGGLTFLVLTRLKLMTSVHDVRRRTVGAEILTLGFLAAFVLTLAQPMNFVSTILVLTFADPIAGLVGQATKSEKKTLVGSVAFFVVAFIVLLASAPLHFWVAALIALVVAVVERYTPLGYDNLSIPVITAALLMLF